ncbi:uncharacterized protein SPAPADRAFT_137676 [Spathaspora passalidarum NRRL Y-27907]|uniref:Uncharacterized protein n=1 Tax=Spathaspora passalidarum (strain NRRL Y-27907 / 11-Y1) TaxID=619300 RepID=G3AMB7_SPAPN|nr:uncharacterized protein SPAPADRAFT_137676 [Spathaspora passalidarum NRRL Y-27907]EGW33415.1 hypothetical protein SPAPADRAFT_137676 [Spathaspora passalidarum NRRL Y-27907]
MKVTIRLSTEISYTITIPDNATVEDLKNSAKVGCPVTSTLPPDFKLIYNGEKLQPHYQPLSAFGITTNDVTVILMSNVSDTPPVLSPSSSQTEKITTSPTIKKTKKKNKCSFKSCSNAPLRMVGTCSHCQGKFCAKHRLLEDHLCTGLQFCKDDAHQKNAMKLQSESTIASRV